MTSPTIDDVFARLDDWRGFPAYQLERRADIYFALFLPLVLKEHFGLKAEPDLIPEFPLRHGTLGTNRGCIGADQSVKVDFAAVSLEDCRVFLVELKTDITSKRPKQDEYLQIASGIHFSKLVDGICEIERQTTQKEKYANLIKRLKQIGVKELPPKLQPEIVYVQPKESKRSDVNKADYIYFAEFEAMIKGRGDIADRFAKSLRGWMEPPA